MPRMPRAIVIGGGFGGMAAALRLRRKGYEVTLIDKQDKLGGRAYAYEVETPVGTFKHDGGPTVITARFLFDELFALFGKRREDYVEFRDIYPWYRIVFAGERGTGAPPVSESGPDTGGAPVPRHFDYGGTIEQFEEQIRKFEPRDVEGFRRYLAHSKRIFDKGFTELGDQPFDKFTTMLRCAPDLMRLGSWRTVWGMTKRYIRNENLRRVFSFQPLLVGGNPFNTTSIYSLIFYLERQWGVQFAMGGTGAIVAALERLMREEGVEIRLGEEVSRIEVDDQWFGGTLGMWRNHKLAKGASLKSGAQISATTVVCNGDTPLATKTLIDPEHRWRSDVQIARLKYSMGLFVLYFGTTRAYPDVAHHTIVLGRAYRDLLYRLFDKRELEREDLSVYLHRPTATDPSFAPPGCESFYVLVPVPNLQPRPLRAPTVREGLRSNAIAGSTAETPPSRSGLRDVPVREDGAIDWRAFGETFKRDVIRYLERTVLPGLSECVVGDFFVTPEHFRDNLNTMYGTGFSVQPIFRQSAWFRFHNRSEDVDGLYFVGAGTHPGAGMPGVLCSAKVVDRLIPAVG